MPKILAVKKCDWCGSDIEIMHKERLSHKHFFCCKKCESLYRKSQSEKNCICPVCHTPFHIKPYRKNKNMNTFCSKECKRIYDSQKMLGEGNHQYGLKGSLNASWRSDERISTYGYKMIRCLDHPLKNSDDFVFEHRLIVEANMLVPENSVIINGKQYLSPNWDVHHIDFNRLNNNPENLFPLPNNLHKSFHNRNKDLKESSIEEKRNRFFDFIKGEAMCQGIIQQFFKTVDDEADGIRNGGLGSITEGSKGYERKDVDSGNRTTP